MNFWTKLQKPIIGLAPMDGITDFSYRQIAALYGQPDVMFTEFVNVKGLWLGKLKQFPHLLFNAKQKPIVAQLFGSDPDYFYKAAHIICELGFDGLDLNMGCPVKKIIATNGGASLIAKPKLVQKIIAKTKQGVKDWDAGQTLKDLDLAQDKIDWIDKYTVNKKKKNLIPVSVKTRLGVDKNIIKDWIEVLIAAQPSSITVHGRTLKQLYFGSADWEAIAGVAKRVKKAGIIYLGNGDVKSKTEAKQKCQQYNLDGVLIGRAALGNPWVFNDQIVTVKQKLNIALKHAQIFTKINNTTNIEPMRKHFGWYCKGFAGAKKLRLQLIQAKNLDQVQSVINEF